MPQLNVALKVERVVERRDPAHNVPTHRMTVRYELESKLRYPGRMFDDRQREILALRKFQEEAAPLLAQPALYRTQLENLIRKVAFQLDHQPARPYRKARCCISSRVWKPAAAARRPATPEEVITAVARSASASACPTSLVPA